MAKDAKRVQSIQPLDDASEIRGATSDSESKPPLSGGEGGDSKPEDGATESQGGSEGGTGFTSPLSLESPSGAKRGRGRPPGARNKQPAPAEEAVQNLDSDLAGLIASTNLLLAGLLEVKEFADVPQEKNRKFAGAIKKLGAVYDKTLSPKAAAWSNLVIAASSSYGPVAYAIWLSREPKPPVPQVEAPAKPNGAVRPPLSTPSKEKAKLAEVPSQVWNQSPIGDGDF